MAEEPKKDLFGEAICQHLRLTAPLAATFCGKQLHFCVTRIKFRTAKRGIVNETTSRGLCPSGVFSKSW